MYSDLQHRPQACCIYQVAHCLLQEGHGEQGVQHKDSTSRCLQQKPGSERPECELQAFWILSLNLLSGALLRLDRES